MNKVYLTCFAFLSSLMITERCSTVKTLQNSGNIVLPKTINLFNRKNLDGWYTFLKDRGRDNDPNKVFTVHDGLLHISGKEWGCITTKEEYGNYKLVAEFHWGTRTYAPRTENARDNGVLLNSTGVDGGASGISEPFLINFQMSSNSVGLVRIKVS